MKTSLRFGVSIRGEAGFNLIELVTVVGILAVVTAGTSAYLLSEARSQIKLGSKANLIQTSDRIAKAFGSSTRISGARSCSDILRPVNTFSPNGETDVRLDFGGQEVYQAGGQVSGVNNFSVNRIYLTDKIDLAPQRPNTYLASLYLVGDIGPADNALRSKPRNVATIVLKLNPDQTIAECNVSVPNETDAEICNGMYGMTYNGRTCVQALNVDNNYNLANCPAGTRNISGVCLPTPSGCANGQVAKGFDLGVTQGCAEPPLNPAVGVATLGVPPPVEGQPNQVPPRAVASVEPLVPVTSVTIPPSTSPTTPPAACGVDGETMDPINYAYCQQEPECLARINGVTSTNCSSTQPTAYVPPPANTTTPSNAPPADNSCQCSTARIPHGEYCSYCSRNVNIGYAFVDYAYAVNRCENGNLVPVPGAAFDPTGECAGGYAPTRYDRNNFRQYGGYDAPNLQ